MLLSRLNLSLLSGFFLASQVSAQVGTPAESSESTSIGAKVPIDSPLPDEDATSRPGPMGIPEEPPGVFAPVRFEATHADGYRAAAHEKGQVFDQGGLSFKKQNEERLTNRRLNWDVGESADYNATAGAFIHEERQRGAHRPTLELGWSGRAFRGDGATLDEIFQASQRTLNDFTRYVEPQTTRSDGSANLGDTVEVGAQSTVSVTGEYRQNHYNVKDVIDDGSRYEAGQAEWKLGLGREAVLDTSFRRSLILYQNRISQLAVGQSINEANSIFVQSISVHYQAGLGVRSLDWKRTGPVFTVIRKPDERASGALRLSYLSGEGTHQMLGSLQSTYRWTHRLTMTLNLEQDLNLLAAYTSSTTAARTEVRQQNLTRSNELLWKYDDRLSVYSLAISANRQDYQTSVLTQTEARLSVNHRVNILDSFGVAGGWKHYTEEGAVLRSVDRRAGLAAFDWKHYWSLGNRLLGPRVFSGAAVSYERLWEGQKEKERETLSLALGQEWL
ncbi:MAG: hypothetical protein H7249_04870 [Chitinophagaceae bacterium]|nr:hypothetical protein [Oligoflexus sp.]